MKNNSYRSIVFLLPIIAFIAPCISSLAQTPVLSRAPYQGAIVVDVSTGRTIFEDRADEPAYPASVVKLMDLLIILELEEKGSLRLTDPVVVTAEAAKMGGSQVFLKEKEVFPVEELLHALMIQSANDAAVALAIHVAGSKEKFVEMMNQRARQLGMLATRYESVHGLPPGRGQKPDVTTARDQAILARALIGRPEAFRFTSARTRPFRNDSFIMRNHNPLLSDFPGCDGLKTGFFSAAGFSISATAVRNDRRIIAVVMGSRERTERNSEAMRLLSKGFLELPPLPPQVAQQKTPASPAEKQKATGPRTSRRNWIIGAVILLLAAWAFAAFLGRKSRPSDF